jgi:type II secretory pathway component PulK
MIRTSYTDRHQGFILVVVLGTVVALCALLLGFARAARTSLGQADGFYRSEQAWNGAWGGLQIAAALVRDANDSGVQPQSLNLCATASVYAVGDANCVVTITEENGLLNINRLLTPDGQPDRRHIEQLLRLLDVLNRAKADEPPLEYGLAPALIDWLDRDDEVTENDYYQTRTPPYPCRNGPVGAVEELAPVKGLTPETFGRLRPLLTCRGDGKIDLNAAPPLVLQSLSEPMDAALADRIVQYRKLKPFANVSELRRIPGMTAAIARDLEPLATVRPPERFYRVTACGRLQGHHCTIEAVLRRNPQAATVDILHYREL